MIQIVKIIFLEDKDTFILHNQYHSDWLYGDTRNQGISCIVFGLVPTKYSSISKIGGIDIIDTLFSSIYIPMNGSPVHSWDVLGIDFLHNMHPTVSSQCEITSIISQIHKARNTCHLVCSSLGIGNLSIPCHKGHGGFLNMGQFDLCIFVVVSNWQYRNSLTHWGRDKMVAIFQTTFPNGFSWGKMYEFRLTFHWSLFLGVQLTIFQHWFR